MPIPLHYQPHTVVLFNMQGITVFCNARDLATYIYLEREIPKIDRCGKGP